MDTAHSLHASRRRHHADRAARRQTLAPPAGRQTQKVFGIFLLCIVAKMIDKVFF